MQVKLQPTSCFSSLRRKASNPNRYGSSQVTRSTRILNVALRTGDVGAAGTSHIAEDLPELVGGTSRLLPSRRPQRERGELCALAELAPSCRPFEENRRPHPPARQTARQGGKQQKTGGDHPWKRGWRKTKTTLYPHSPPDFYTKNG